MIRFSNLKAYVRFVESLPAEVSKVTMGTNFNMDKTELAGSGIDHGVKSIVLLTLSSVGQFYFAKNYDLIDSDLIQEVQKLYLSLEPVEGYRFLQIPPFDDKTFLIG